VINLRGYHSPLQQRGGLIHLLNQVASGSTKKCYVAHKPCWRHCPSCLRSLVRPRHMARAAAFEAWLGLCKLIRQKADREQAAPILDAFLAEEASMRDIRQSARDLGIELVGVKAAFDELVSQTPGLKRTGPSL